MSTSRVVQSHSEQDTIEAGRELSASLRGGDVVRLYGDLGAGKTAFVRGLVAGLGIDPEDVSSPTFTIVQEYRGPRLTLQHVDLYRLSTAEVTDLALEDLTGPDVVMAIEWADRLPTVPLLRGVDVRIAHAGEGRRLEITDGRQR